MAFRRCAAVSFSRQNPLVSRITEGFDTLDLKEAKALLDELSSVWY